MGELLLVVTLALSGQTETPSRRPAEGCVWEKISDPNLGLQAWVQRCDFGSRKIDFFLKGNSLNIRYSDGGPPYSVVEVLDLLPGESEEKGLTRLFGERTPNDLAKRCRLSAYKEDHPPAHVTRFTFVPDAQFQKELDAKAHPDEVPDPACGDWGEAPDGIQYFEVQPGSGARRVLFVRVGQDEPLFDENTLRLSALNPKR